MKGNKLKVIGLITTVAGFVLSLVSNAVAEKKLDNTIEEKVTKALEQKNK